MFILDRKPQIVTYLLQIMCYNDFDIFRNTDFNWFLTRLVIAFCQHVVTSDNLIFQLTFPFGMHVYMGITDSVDSFVYTIIILYVNYTRAITFIFDSRTDVLESMSMSIALSF